LRRRREKGDDLALLDDFHLLAIGDQAHPLAKGVPELCDSHGFHV
jgi:hypothetical protein